ncbi:hypothetical protein OH76DRAFT_540058 [Lentinus brumalis]|uniref:Uncharacterized protein n=1 Tax=Lentinus brumalis TaxID=2498619 RepID=A0A371D9L7_9APHY|nr:hypothetical protein OH76DRAFT_540058 [Polyporus brumalis]
MRRCRVDDHRRGSASDNVAAVLAVGRSSLLTLRMVCRRRHSPCLGPSYRLLPVPIIRNCRTRSILYTRGKIDNTRSHRRPTDDKRPQATPASTRAEPCGVARARSFCPSAHASKWPVILARCGAPRFLRDRTSSFEIHRLLLLVCLQATVLMMHCEVVSP